LVNVENFNTLLILFYRATHIAVHSAV